VREKPGFETSAEVPVGPPWRGEKERRRKALPADAVGVSGETRQAGAPKNLQSVLLNKHDQLPYEPQ
jgi:hypothetical protein